MRRAADVPAPVVFELSRSGLAVQLDDGNIMHIAEITPEQYRITVRDATNGTAVISSIKYWASTNTPIQQDTSEPLFLVDPRTNPNILEAKRRMGYSVGAGAWGPIASTATLPSQQCFSAYLAIHNGSRVLLGVAQVTLLLSWFSTAFTFSPITANTHAFIIDAQGYLLASSHSAITPEVRNVTNTSSPVPPGCTKTVTTPIQYLCRPSIDNYSCPVSHATSGSLPMRATKKIALQQEDVMGGRIDVEDVEYLVSTRHLRSRLKVQLGFNLVVIVPVSDIIADFVAARTVGIVTAISLTACVVAACAVGMYFALLPLSSLATEVSNAARLGVTQLPSVTFSKFSEIGDLQIAYTAILGRLLLLRKFVPHSVFTTSEPPQLILVDDPSGSSGESSPLQGETVDYTRMNVARNTFHHRSCSILCVELFNLESPNAGKKSDDVAAFMDATIASVSKFNGVIDLMQPPQLIASFNAHRSCQMHEFAAVSCALRIRDKLLSTSPSLRFAISVTSSDCCVGNCGAGDRSALVAIGECVDLARKLPYLQHSHVGWHVVIGEHVAEGISSQQMDLLPVDRILPCWDQADRSRRVTLFVVVPHRSSPSASARLTRHDTLQALRHSYVNIVSGKGEQPDELRKLCSGVCDDAFLLHYTEYLFAINEHASPNRQHVRHETSLWEQFPWDRALSLGTVSVQQPHNVAEAEAVSTQLREAMALPVLAQADAQEPDEVAADEPLPFPMFAPVAEDADLHNSLSTGMGGMGDGGEEPLIVHTRDGEVWRRTEEPLGSGAFGKVYRGMSESGAVAAMKFQKLQSNIADVGALEGELLTMMRIQHRNVVRYVSSSVTQSYLVIVMEYLAGGSLCKLIQLFGALDPESVRRFACNMLRGLECLHEHGIIHCDVKPANVLLGTNGICKLTDFGSVVNRKKARVGEATVDDLKGTPVYMAPEVANGDDPTEASDVWSFGMSVLELLLGCCPWKGREANKYSFLISLSKDPTFVPSIPSDLELHDVLQRCLSRDATLRPSVSDLLLEFTG